MAGNQRRLCGSMRIIMKPIILAFLICSSCAGTSWAQFWPKAVQCTLPIAGSLLGTVAEALNHGDWRQRLSNFAITHGAAAIICAAEQIRDSSPPPVGVMAESSNTAVTETQRNRADTFLKEIGRN
jgi:hypothetical protein